MKHLYNRATSLITSIWSLIILCTVSPTTSAIINNQEAERLIAQGNGKINLSPSIKKDLPPAIIAIPLPGGIPWEALTVLNATVTQGAGPVSSYGQTISGTAEILEDDITIPVVFYNSPTEGWSLEFILDDTFKFSSLHSSLNALDTIKFAGNIRFIISTAKYTDPQTQLEVRPINLLDPNSGVNIFASAALDSPFLKNLTQTLTEIGKSFSSDATLTLLHCHIFIPGYLSKTTLELSFPLQMGVNFTSLYRAGKIPWQMPIFDYFLFKDVIYKLSLADLFNGAISSLATAAGQEIFDVRQASSATTPAPNLSGALTNTARFVIGLTTQKEPLKLTAEVSISAKEFRALGTMKGMYKQVLGIPWLDLGEFRIGTTSNFKLIALMTSLTGTPISGLDLGGEFSLGSGKNKSTANVSGKINLSAEKIPDFALDGSITQLPFTALWEFLTSAIFSYNQDTEVKTRVNQQETAIKRLPNITLHNLALRIAFASPAFGNDVNDLRTALKDSLSKKIENTKEVLESTQETLHNISETISDTKNQLVEAQRHAVQAVTGTSQAGTGTQTGQAREDEEDTKARLEMSYAHFTEATESLEMSYTHLTEAKESLEKIIYWSQGLKITGGITIGSLTGNIKIVVTIPDLPDPKQIVNRTDLWIAQGVTGFFLPKKISEKTDAGLTGIAAGLEFLNFLDQFQIIGHGSLSPIVTKLFEFTGTSNQTPGPLIELIIQPTNDILFRGSARLAIPLLGLSRIIDFNIGYSGLYALIGATNLWNTKMEYIQFNLPFDSSIIDDFVVQYKVSSTLMESIKSSVKNFVDATKNSIDNAVNAKQKQFEQKIKETEELIATQTSQQKRLQEECDKQKQESMLSTTYWKGKICLDAKIKELGASINNLSNTLTKLKSSLVSGVATIPKALLDTSGHIADAVTFFDITKMSGSIKGTDLKEGKVARVGVECTINVGGFKTVKTFDVAIDFAHPLDTAKSIGEQIIKFIGLDSLILQNKQID